ncbi:RNA polymerase sigma-70 factor [Dysgonomonas sp. ZJ709]|uniref:RNA polymerase sigma-70 factor n=1 Tax=Dysgonomonas sp. ZJ709 TaxID=2709797 RepID=UPI002103E2BD|nr:RNA polymerase sigma-70 factor [Dysgonomonas sp. ZJ709]
MDHLLMNNTFVLVNKLASEDSEAALGSLYELYFERLVRFVYVYVQSENSAEEVVADVFISIWLGRKELVNIENFNSYIFTIARNKAISYFRKEEKHYNMQKQSTVDIYKNTETTPEDDFISKELIEKFNEAVNSLPTQCKTVFILIREDKLKYKDVAVVLNISIKTVEAHMAKATKILRRLLEDRI